MSPFFLSVITHDHPLSLHGECPWNRDRFRTTINVWGDCLGAAIVAHLSQKELSKTPKPEPTTMDPNDIEMGGTDPDSWDKVNGDKLNTITAKGGTEDPAESTAI